MGNKRRMLLVLLVLSVLMLGGFADNVDSSDKVAFFSNLAVPGDTLVEGSAVAIFGNVTIDGAVRGDSVAVFGNVTVNGTVDGDVVAVFGTIRITDKAVVRGDAVGVGGGVDKAPGAVVRGDIEDITSPFGIDKHNLLPVVTYASILGILVMFGISCLAVLLIPDRMKMMTDQSLQKLGRRFGIGLVAYLLFVPVIILLAITIIGLLVIPFFIAAFFIVAFIGLIAISIAVGQKIAGSMDGNKNAIYVHLLIGVVILYVLKLIPVFGWLVYIALMIIAMGVAVDTRLGGGILRKQVRG